MQPLIKEKLMTENNKIPVAYSETSHGVKVNIQPVYLEHQSQPDAGQYFWAYHVRIENHRDTSAQLLTRHWRIIDARGQAHDVIGDGVIGEKPILTPGAAFEYTSGTPLSTSTGFMSGSFRMIAEGGEQFDVAVPAFSLDSQTGSPSSLH